MRDSAVRRWSSVHARLYTLTGGRVGSRLVDNDMLLLTTTGRDTGRDHTVPLLYLKEGERLVVIASYGGRASHPDWFRNLQAHPLVRVRIGERSNEMKARVATDEERSLWWPRAVEAYSDYAVYQTRTDRVIPIVFLEPVR